MSGNPYILINDTYIVGPKLGKGSFGEVYLGKHKYEGHKLAIKLEPLDSKSHILEREYRVYQDIYHPNAGICQVYYFGLEDDYAVLVMDLLGHSLGYRMTSCGGKFTLKTTLMIADQMISRLEYLHEKGFIHRDLKPDNMLVGRGHQQNQIFLIDYGLSKRYRNANRHVSYKEGGKLVGTARYASTHSHRGIQLSRRDDLISLGYILIYFLRGKLPWQKVRGKTKEEKYDNIRKLKEGLGYKTICHGLPKELQAYLSYCYDMEFTSRPDYNYLRSLFKNLFRQRGYTYDLIFDWQ